jgi:hypothetical protein
MFKTLTGAIDPKKNPSLDEIQKIPSFIFCKWLSGNPMTINAANGINMYDDIPIENQYWMVKYAFAGKIKYIPYPKNVSEKQLKEVEFISRHFNISEEKAHEYRDLLSAEEKHEIVQMYTELELKGKK